MGLFQEKRDNLLLEADILYHFRGIILCNAERRQFNHLKKQECKGTVQQDFYVLTLSFWKLTELLLTYVHHKKNPFVLVTLSFLMAAG